MGGLAEFNTWLPVAHWLPGVTRDEAVDPTLFLSTLAVVDATIIAIVGGLLVARLAALATSKEEAEGRFQACRDRVEHCGTEVKNAQEEKTKLGIELLRMKLLPRLLNERGAPGSAANLLQGVRHELSPDEANGVVTELRTQIHEAFGDIQGRAQDVSLDWPLAFDAAQDKLRLEVPAGCEEMYRRAYASLQTEAQERTRNRERQRQLAQQEAIAVRLKAAVDAGDTAIEDSLRALVTRPVLPPVRTAVSLPPPDTTDLAKRYGGAVETLKQRERELHNALDDKDKADQHRGDVRAGDVMGSLVALGWIAFANLLPSLILMADEPSALAVWWRIGLVASLGVGIVRMGWVTARSLKPGLRVLFWLRPK